ncbi:Inactive receptor-like serine/threonine-protein kinase [Raphanus sativus]|uniref:Inactive receptor-like serine/threonine-protein kinase At2g40270 n=1 Tax=Raphanus sativus TaxID=3726 RepID=A0A9W3DMI0_RAPSA|nr:inactive receptor-like serine/threonine-protein kinase At2g40270 [Raphanus sativus]KAJ4903960.1 Inactive receptor-like serine/threonine-protein kinase [Raphanus sativus]
MNEKRRSTVSSIPKMRSLAAIILLLSFSSCYSLKEEGLDKDRLEKDLWSDEDSAILKAVGFHRKALAPRSPVSYDKLPSRRNSSEAGAATITPPSSSPQPSQKNVSTQSSTALDPGTTQDVSPSPPPPPPSVPEASSPTPRTSASSSSSSSSSSVVGPVVAACVGGVVLIILVATGVFYFRRKVGKSVNPWHTGLSGQLQKVFVTGIPTLKRSEIEAACEDFSNVIGSCPIGKLFKGTLSSGVEIAVASINTTCAKDWKDNTEIQFRKKIEMLSKINHKNFVNLLGYCEENEPFTRILIFEYAPNGSLFEHLHSKESEHLDWGMRLRISMGLAYCLDHMHQLSPPIAHTNLVSSSLHLTEDYAVKLADFSFGPSDTETCNNANKDTDISDNVYSFGLLLFEMITGKLVDSVNKPDSVDTGLVDFLRGESLAKMVDPALESCDDKIENIGEVIKSCIRTDPKERPTMKEVTGWLREITGISPSDATPSLSPLWWAELEVLSIA